MPKSLARAVIDAIIPRGLIWSPDEDANYDNFLEAVSDEVNRTKAFLSKQALVRDAMQTEILEDLEKEYGIVTDTTLTEDQRRVKLAAVMYSGSGTGTVEDLQAHLDAGAFGLTVYQNDPPANPDDLITRQYNAYCGHEDSLCGHESAVCGEFSDFLVVNGDIDSLGGLVHYKTPPEEYWHLVFFIGGAVTRDVDDTILTIAPVSIPLTKRLELIRIIVRHKPIESWAALAVEYT